MIRSSSSVKGFWKPVTQQTAISFVSRQVPYNNLLRMVASVKMKHWFNYSVLCYMNRQINRCVVQHNNRSYICLFSQQIRLSNNMFHVIYFEMMYLFSSGVNFQHFEYYKELKANKLFVVLFAIFKINIRGSVNKIKLRKLSRNLWRIIHLF